MTKKGELAVEVNKIYCGDCREVLRGMPDESVHCVVTSPPYYSLRDYGVEPVVWNGDELCEHVWGEEIPNSKEERRSPEELSSSSTLDGGKQKVMQWQIKGPKTSGQFCQKCGAWLGSLGLEPSPELYVKHIVDIFREVRRVLRSDGVAFVNIGDSYFGGKGQSGTKGSQHQDNRHETGQSLNTGYQTLGGWKETKPSDGRHATLKPKDLCLIPQRLAIALQDSGWWVRSIIIWSKNNPMPECLDPATFVFIKAKGRVRRVMLDELERMGPNYPKILTPDGWRSILNVWEQYSSNVMGFDAAKVSHVTASQLHTWPVSHDRRRLAIHHRATVQLRDSGYKDYLLHYTIDEWLESPIVKYWGFDLDYDMGWLVGLYVAEGGFGEVRGFRCKFTLHADETGIVARLRQLVRSKLNVSVSQRHIKNYRQVRFSSQEWYAFAKGVVYGKVTTKSLNLDVVLNSPREFRQGIWDGYMAGDGSKRGKDGFIAVSASRLLRDNMAVLASSIGIITSKGKRIPKDSRTKKIYKSYSIWTPFISKRQTKKGTAARQIIIRNKRFIPGIRRMIDVEVEGDGLFLIDDGLVTHNSVRDRPTTAHEYVLLLAKSRKYYYDADAIRESISPATIERSKYGWNGKTGDVLRVGRRAGSMWKNASKETWDNCYNLAGRNKHTVWTIPTQPYPEAHFATFPKKLIEPMILAG
jgi:DNA modification methylase